jgi:hypothetical protein
LLDQSHQGEAQTAVNFMTSILQASTEYSMITLGLDGTIRLWNAGAQTSLIGIQPEVA